MAEAKRDGNYVTTLLGVTDDANQTPTNLIVDPTTKRLKVSATLSAALEDLSDVVITNVQDGDVLTYDSGTGDWINEAAAGGGDFSGPASSTDNAIVRFDGTGGKTGQNSGVTISDTNVVLIPSLTASEIVITDASKNLVSAPVATYPSLTELTYVKGVTSAIQTQLDSKATGPASSTDNAIARFDSTTGKLLQNSTVLVGDTGAVTGVGDITGVAAGITISTATNGNLTLDPGGSGTLTLNADSGGVVISTDGGNGDVSVTPHGTGDFIVNTTGLVVDTSASSVGINTASPDVALDVHGTGFPFIVNSTDSNGLKMKWEDNGTVAGYIGSSTILGNSFYIGNTNAVTQFVVKDTSGNVGVGTDSPDVKLHAESDSAATNTVTDVFRITSTSTGTPAAGIGVGMAFEVETAASNNEVGARIEAVTTDVTATSEDVDLAFYTMEAGAPATEAFRVKSTGTVAVATDIELGNASDTTLSRSSAGVLAVEGVVIPSISSINTLTNKRITKRVQAVASSATVTASLDDDDMVTITAQAEALTLANPSGTGTQGQPLVFRIKDNGTARAISYGANFRAIGVTLPTTTVISKTIYLGGFWNSTDTKLDITAVAEEA